MSKFVLSRNDRWLGIVSFLNDLSSEMIFPILPFFLAHVLGFSKGVIGLIEGVGAAATSVFQGVSGSAADKLNQRKPIVVAGYALSTFVKPFFALAASPALVLGLRFFDRAGKGVRTAPRDALISLSTARGAQGAAFGFNRAMDTAGAIVGTVFVFILLFPFTRVPEEVYRMIFFISFVPGVLAVFALILFVRDVSRRRVRPPRIFAWGKVSRHAKEFFAVATVFSFANASYAFFLLRAASLGMEERFAPIAYILLSVIAALFFIPIGRWTDARGRAGALVAGYILFAAVAYLFAHATLPTLWVLFALYGLSLALTDGVSRALVADLIHADVRGTAFGIYHTLTGLAALGASVLFGVLWDRMGERVPFLVSSGIALFAALLFVAFLIRHRGHGHAELFVGRR